MTKIYKCSLFAAGYIFSASFTPYSCTASKDSFEQIEKNGKNMKKKLMKFEKNFIVGLRILIIKLKLLEIHYLLSF